MNALQFVYPFTYLLLIVGTVRNKVDINMHIKVLCGHNFVTHLLTIPGNI